MFYAMSSSDDNYLNYWLWNKIILGFLTTSASHQKKNIFFPKEFWKVSKNPKYFKISLKKENKVILEYFMGLGA